MTNSNNSIKMNRDTLALAFAIDLIMNPDDHAEFIHPDFISDSTTETELADLIGDDIRDMLHNTNEGFYLNLFNLDDSMKNLNDILDLFNTEGFDNLVASLVLNLYKMQSMNRYGF